MSLWLIFGVIFAVAFGVMMFLLRFSRQQNVMVRRMAAVIAPRSAVDNNRRAMTQYLVQGESGRFGRLEGLAAGAGLLSRFQLFLLQADSTVSVGVFLVLIFGSALTAFGITYGITSRFGVSACISTMMGYVPVGWMSVRRTRRIEAFNSALPECVALCARSLRAGHSIAAAINMVGEEGTEPVKTEFAEVFKKHNYGLSLREALMQMLNRVPSMDLRLFVTGILVQKDTGGNLAEIFDRIVSVIRDRMRIQGEIRTHTAQGRLTGWILLFLPIFIFIIMNFINPGYANILFEDPKGQKVFYAGVVMLIVGGLVIRRVVNEIEV